MKVRIGNRYEKLIVQERFLGEPGHKEFLCLCDCGRQTIVRGTSLESGNTKSCGCLVGSNIKHGKSSSRSYKSWQLMKDRCLNTNSDKYPNYGGRGIKIDPAWMDFANFYADMGDRPKNFELDRIFNDGDYTKLNCRWATKSESLLNQRHRKFTVTLRSLTINELEDLLTYMRGLPV